MTYNITSPTANVPQGFDAFSLWITESIRLLREQWQVWLLQTLLLFGISTIPSFLAQGVGVLSAQGMIPEAVMLGFTIVLSIIASVLQLWLMLGMYYTALKQVRGEEIAFGDIFAGGQFMLGGIGLYLYTLLIMLLGLLACGVGMLAVPGIVFLSYPILIDQRVGSSQAISRSFEAMKQNFWLFVLFAIVVPFIASVGMLACCVGVVLTYGFMFIASAVAYQSVFGGGVSAPSYPGGMLPVAPPPPYTPYAREVPPEEPTPTVSKDAKPATDAVCAQCHAPLSPGQEICQYCGAKYNPGTDADA